LRPIPNAFTLSAYFFDAVNRYELTGGFIKNAVMSALMQACARDIDSPVISEEDIMQGCSMQMRGYLQMKATDFVGSIIPKKGLADIILEASKPPLKHQHR